ncbi:MAG: DUF4385 domain-containing protein [Bacteroidetes bacterium]|nr:DUF4385 domain-containing protein [Bacteroidota bacterium]
MPKLKLPKRNSCDPSPKQQRLVGWEKIKKTYPWKDNINYRVNPELYLIGKGEQGVLICEPYKSEILPYWRFKNPEIATQSSTKIFDLFLDYLSKEEFVGADMARKFLQMGFTRARRYNNHHSGRKYDKITGEELPRDSLDLIKSESAKIFYEKWKAAEENSIYRILKLEWKKKYG